MFRSKELNGPGKNQREESVISKISIGSPNGIFPKTTSTPSNLGSPQSRRNRVLQPLLSRQGTPRRYSLSDTNSPTPKPHSNPYASNSTGPLLASMSFVDNVSLYEETKSSGLAKRIVSYREAQEEQHPTHQEKYKSPGLFPVVHLFKNSASPLPTKKVKVKLASPEYLRSYSPQHRSKILDEISKPRLHRQLSLPSHAHSNDTGTKSVLDALKEISRKRIHSQEEEIDPLEDLGKRQKTDLFNGNAVGSSKRVRADSPLSDQADSPSSKQRQKKFCVFDEFAASKSSTDFSYLTKSELAKSKRKALSISTESLLVKPKQVKVANAETQTPAPEPEKKLETREPQPEEIVNEPKKKKDYPLKVFDDAPLQRIRKSRLAALMGTMLGKDIVIPIEEQTTDSVNEAVGKKSMDEPKVSEIKKTDSTDSVLKSILTPVKSSEEILKPKNVEEKHVHFNISTTASTVVSQSPLIQSSTAISSQSENTIKESPSVSVSAVKTTSETSKPAFSFGSVNKTDTVVSSPSVSTPMFNFAKPMTESKSDNKVTTSPPKIGGFKFDLNAPSVSKTTVPTLNFPAISTAVATTASSATFSFGTPAVTSTPAISFGSPTNQSKPTFSFGAPPKSDTPVPATEVKPTEAKSMVTATVTTATLTFGSNSQANSTSFKFGAVSNEPQQPVSLGNSVTSASTPSTNVGATTTSTAPSIFGGFGTAKEQTSVSQPQPPSFAFGGANSAFKANPMSFGATTTSTPTSSTMSTLVAGGFGSTTNTGNKSPAVFGGFGGTLAKPTPTFGSATTTAPSFGTSTTTSTTFGSNTVSAPTFGSNTTTTAPSMFSIVPASTTSATFGTTTSTASFNFAAPVTSTPAFGQNLTSSSATPVFASPAAVKPNAFGSSAFGGSNTSAFGSSAATPNQTFGRSSAPAFGSSTAPTNQNSLISFGGNNPPTFGSPTVTNNQNSSATFGVNNTPAFGASANQNTTSTFGSGNNAFGTTTTNQNPSPFGSNAFAAPTATTAPSMFGSNTASSTFTFGANKQQPPNPFGGGVTSTTTAGSSFGSSSSFSSSSSAAGSFSFGGPATAFGTNAQKSTFGTSSAPAFGQTENKPTFSFGAGSTEPKAVPSFGSGATAPAFGAPTTNNNQGFGSGGTPAFGATNPTNAFGSQPQSNGGFNFGANSAGSTTFAFGSNAANKEVPKPTFNFTGNSNAPAFGTAPTPSFGASSSFTSQPQQFMGASAPAGGVFTIGSGSTPGSRPRAQIRAKRRT